MMNPRIDCINTSARRITNYYHGSRNQSSAILVHQHVNQLFENNQSKQQSRCYHHRGLCSTPSKMVLLYKKSLSLPLFSIINSNKLMLTNSNLGTLQRRHFTKDIPKEVEITTTATSKQKIEQKQTKKKRQRIFIPSKAPVTLTPASREFFKRLTENTQKHVLLEYQMSQTGEPRMVFTFTLLAEKELMTDKDKYETTRQEGVVSLELLDTEEKDPKPPKDAIDDGLLKLYVGQNAFLKVLGCVIDIHPKTGMPIVQDKYGNTMDPNA